MKEKGGIVDPAWSKLMWILPQKLLMRMFFADIAVLKVVDELL